MKYLLSHSTLFLHKSYKYFCSTKCHLLPSSLPSLVVATPTQVVSALTYFGFAERACAHISSNARARWDTRQGSSQAQKSFFPPSILPIFFLSSDEAGTDFQSICKMRGIFQNSPDQPLKLTWYSQHNDISGFSNQSELPSRIENQTRV